MDELKCVDCGKLPPEAESAYTLIGGKSGWRLTRHRDDEGKIIPEWRCPDCWVIHKKSAAQAKPGVPQPGPVSKRVGPGGGRSSD